MAGLLDEDTFEDLAAETPRPNPIEQGIVYAANAVWAVVGLLLWLPQLFRVLLLSSVRIVHAALTRQPAETVRGPIRRVSRFYRDGFLKPGRVWSQGVFSRRELLLGRVLGEALWAALFYLLVLRLLDPVDFDRAWAALKALGGRLLEGTASLLAAAVTLLPDSLAGLRELDRPVLLVLLLLVVLALAGGYALGRRGRR